MSNTAQIRQMPTSFLEERANRSTRQTDCIRQQQTFSEIDVVQMLVFGWLYKPDTRMKMLTSKEKCYGQRACFCQTPLQ
ncbi:hypothetical protein [Ktedonospora formicarum]|uniref:Uncharacterized protein n=1 Tax=Ktedonospora formicarum TaxID=2778364 RepID=A0A8J3MZD6_9CHLR|nr:hypothetical protein [Ktedonospora formicarum]GHO50690.1 hypothetical protein KSX_88530 [Ktedonospora formicarum]